MKRFLMVSWLILFTVASISRMTVLAQGDSNSAPRGGYHQIRPWAVGCRMEGTVTNVTVVDGRIQFQLTGWFWLHQFPEGGTNGEQVIKVDCQHGISATVNDPDSFVAMSSDLRVGAVTNGKGKLLKILQTAAERGNEVRFELMDAKVDFGGKNGFTLLDGKVWRITDADLR